MADFPGYKVHVDLVDAGPLIALFDRGESRHAATKAWFAKNSAQSRLLSTEAVVTEVTHLLDFSVPVQTDFLRWSASILEVTSVDTARYGELAGWMDGHANAPMDFADATLLLLYLAIPGGRILTFDERGFGVFRLPGRPGKLPRLVKL